MHLRRSLEWWMVRVSAASDSTHLSFVYQALFQDQIVLNELVVLIFFSLNREPLLPVFLCDPADQKFKLSSHCDHCR